MGIIEPTYDDGKRERGRRRILRESRKEREGEQGMQFSVRLRLHTYSHLPLPWFFLLESAVTRSDLNRLPPGN